MNSDPDIIKGKDEKGYFIMTRECVHTDGTPDEWVKTYYEPCPTSDGMNFSQTFVDEWIGEQQHERDGKTD